MLYKLNFSENKTLGSRARRARTLDRGGVAGCTAAPAAGAQSHTFKFAKTNCD
jgi:hypothetical protein